MKRGVPPALAAPFAVSLTVALLLFLVQCALAIALAGQATFWRFRSPVFDPALLAAIMACLALNGFVLARAVKARHFLGLFGAWPGLPEEDSPVQATRLFADSAQQAFFHGDFGVALTRLQRLSDPSSKASLAQGRLLALEGRLDDAVAALQRSGQAASAMRYLSWRKRWIGPDKRYFSGQDHRWALGPLRLLAAAVLALALALPVLNLNYQALSAVLKPLKGVPFSDRDFKTVTLGRFVLHYHDDAFMQQSADVADAALDQSLDFLGLPTETFKAGQIDLYLCADQAEYLARSPYTRSWEAGSALPLQRQIYLYHLPANQSIYYEAVLAHELTHLCYHKLVPQGQQDSWLNEGLANYLGYKFALDRAHFPRQAWLMTKYFNKLKTQALPFTAFLTEDPRAMQDPARIDDFYVQGFSIVYVLVEQYGHDDFLHFVRVFGAGKSLPEALAAAYPTIQSAADLQAVWELFMR